MAVDLKVSVSKEITSLRKIIAQKTSELASFKDELKRHQRVYELLGGQRARTRRMRRGPRVDWNSVLKGLPRSFTVSSIVQKRTLSRKSKVYLRQVLRWVKEGKVKRIERGRYLKS